MRQHRNFIGIDGESYTVDGDHRYVLLACSLGDYVYEPAGLSTSQCFEFLANLREQRPTDLFVAFGLNYDANMMLRDIGRDNLIHLWREHSLDWYSWRINWIPGKWFSVNRRGEKAIRIYDVFGFFQKSFVNALKSWNIELPEDIEEMKASRSIFDEDMRDKMIEYCISECTKLTELMDALRSALKSVGLQPASWVGAGSIASALLRREGVKEWHRPDSEFPPAVARAILHAYFGGRVELFQQGYFPKLIDYDICSAYPSEALNLPPMRGGLWEEAREYEPEADYAIWMVRWNVNPERLVMPFPYRNKRNIYYPSSGMGFYHTPEVRRAIQYYGENIEILGGFIYRPLTNNRPFDFIQKQYEFRRELKRKGHAGEKVLKLGLNAIYGKLAQGHGFNGSNPPFQSYYWAGRITSATRARCFDIAMLKPDSLVMVATDGIFFHEPAPTLKIGTELGDIERSEFTDMFVAQAGVYAGEVDGELVARSRGFFSREIDFEQLREGFDTEGPTFTASYKSIRFVGLGSALMRNDFSVWRTWQEGERKLSLFPNRKFLKEFSPGEPARHYPPSFDENLLSEIYVPKDGAMKWAEEVLEYIAGTEQPMKEF